MGGSSSSSSSNTTSYTTLNTSLEGENPVSIIDSSGVEVQVTDHGAIAQALGFAEQALDVTSDSVNSSNAAAARAYDGAADMVSEQVDMIADLATTLKLGNSELKSWIVIIGIIAISLAVVAYFVWG